MSQNVLWMLMTLFLLLFDWRPEPMELTLLSAYPRIGGVNQTHFVWIAIVESANQKPEVTLRIGNKLPVLMETESTESPWVFTSRQRLKELGDHSYWIEVETGYETLTSAPQTVTVTPRQPESLDFLGFVEDWEVLFESREEPLMDLFLVQSETANVRTLTMEVNESGPNWKGIYDATQLDPGKFHYWVMAQSGEATDNSEVASAEIR